MATQSNQKIINLRALCIILVVLAHSIIIYNGSWGLYTTTRSSVFFRDLCNLIYIFHMPLFFSLSGYLARYSYRKNPTIKDFFIKKFVRILVPFLIIGLLYMIPIRLLAHYGAYQGASPLSVIGNFLISNDSGHLWFLLCLFLIFVMHYFLVRWLRSPRLQFGVVAILFILGHFIPNIIGTAMLYLFWFNLGYLINKYTLDKSDHKTPVYLAGAALSLFAYFLIMRTLGACLLATIFKYICCFAIIVALYKVISTKSSKIFDAISGHSFGIYLFHSPLIYLTFCYLPDRNPLLVFAINFFGFGLVAYLLTTVIKRTPLKFVIGE